MPQSAGRGRGYAGRGSGGGRGRGRNGRGGGSRNNNNNTKKKNNMKGKCEELGNNVFTAGIPNSADVYVKTKEAIMLHIQTNLTDGQDWWEALDAMKHKDMDDVKPPNPALDDQGRAVQIDEGTKLEYTLDLKEWKYRCKNYGNNKTAIFGLMIGQCTDGLLTKLKNRSDWNSIENVADPILLLKAILEAVQKFDDKTYPIATLHKAIYDLVTVKQESTGEKIADYAIKVKTRAEMVENHNGKLIFEKYCKTMNDWDENNATIQEKCIDKAWDQFLAYTLIQGADDNKSAYYKRELINDYAKGHDDYPKNLADATQAISKYKPH